MLVATTGYTYTREQAYNDVRVRSGEQLVRLNVRNEVRGSRQSNDTRSHWAGMVCWVLRLSMT